MVRKNDHDLQSFVANGPGDLKAVAARHVNVEHGNLGDASPQLPPGRFAILSFLHDDELRRLFDDLPESVPEDRMVGSDQNADRIAHCLPHRSRAVLRASCNPTKSSLCDDCRICDRSPYSRSLLPLGAFGGDQAAGWSLPHTVCSGIAGFQRRNSGKLLFCPEYLPFNLMLTVTVLPWPSRE
jgi:hypothetical protein